MHRPPLMWCIHRCVLLQLRRPPYCCSLLHGSPAAAAAACARVAGMDGSWPMAWTRNPRWVSRYGRTRSRACGVIVTADRQSTGEALRHRMFVAEEKQSVLVARAPPHSHSFYTIQAAPTSFCHSTVKVNARSARWGHGCSGRALARQRASPRLAASRSCSFTPRARGPWQHVPSTCAAKNCSPP